MGFLPIWTSCNPYLPWKETFFSLIAEFLNRFLEKPCHSCESRNPEVCSQTEIRIPAPRFREDKFREDKFREDDIYTRILILLKIYVELRLIIKLRHYLSANFIEMGDHKRYGKFYIAFTV